MKKFMSAMLAAALLVSVFAGCNNNSKKTESTSNDSSSSTVDTSQEVKLKLYFLGDEGGETANQALDELNKKLKEKINATLEPAPISWGDWKQKLPVVLASGENYDMIYTANWAYYFSEGAKGAYKELDQLMPTYAPKTYAKIKESGAEDYLKINGKLYMVPTIETSVQTHDIVIREDLRKKYNVPEIKSYEDLDKYYAAIKQNEKSMLPMALSPTVSGMLYSAIQYEPDWARTIVGGDQGVITYKIEDGSKVFSLVDTPEYEAFVKRQRDWYNKGYWSRSVLSEKSTAKDQFFAGKSASTFSNFGDIQSIYSKVKTENPDWEISVWSLDNNKIERTAPAGNGTAIGANSKNPERSLMFLDLAMNDEEVFDLLYYGVKGVNYDLTSDGKITRPEGVSADANLSIRNLGMGILNTELKKPSVTDWDWVITNQEKAFEKSVIPALAGFTINEDNISAEIAAISAVCAEYKVPLDFGTIDPEKGLETLRKKLKDAGIDKVIEEINKQVAEYNANK